MNAASSSEHEGADNRDVIVIGGSAGRALNEGPCFERTRQDGRA